jgi:hypothetical protein
MHITAASATALAAPVARSGAAIVACAPLSCAMSSPGHRQPLATKAIHPGQPGLDQLFYRSLHSRCTAMLAGLRTLIQTRHGPDRYRPSTRLEARTVPALVVSEEPRRFGFLRYAASIDREVSISLAAFPERFGGDQGKEKGCEGPRTSD